jgi:protein TonB
MMNRKHLVPNAYLYLIPLLLLLTVACTSTNSSDEKEKIYLLDELDEAPEFEGGHEEFVAYLIQQINRSPEGTFDSIEGKIYIEFVITKDGKVIDVKVKTPMPLSAGRTLKSIIEESPKWNPGKVVGEPVSSFQIIPVKF